MSNTSVRVYIGPPPELPRAETYEERIWLLVLRAVTEKNPLMALLLSETLEEALYLLMPDWRPEEKYIYPREVEEEHSLFLRWKGAGRELHACFGAVQERPRPAARA